MRLLRQRFDDAMRTLEALQHSKAWRKYRAKAEADEQCKRLPLDSFLILPVQRVPRYKLLVDEMLKCTPSDDADFANLTMALEKIVHATNYINSKTKQLDALLRVWELRRQLRRQWHIRGPLVRPDRWFVDEQAAWVCQSGRPNIERMLLLFNDCLIICSSRRSIVSGSALNVELFIGLRSIDAIDTSVMAPPPDATGSTAYEPGANQHVLRIQYRVQPVLRAARQRALTLCFRSDEQLAQWRERLGHTKADLERTEAYRVQRLREHYRRNRKIPLWRRLFRRHYWWEDDTHPPPDRVV